MQASALRQGDPLWPWMGVAVLLLSIGLHGVALIDPDEGRYAAAARTMSRTGDLVVPMFNGAPRLNKPPLTYWLQAAAMRALGESEVAARLPSAFAALATMGAGAWFARRRLPSRAAPATVAVLATTPYFFAVAHLAIPDALLTCWCTLALVCWHEATEETDGGTRRVLARAAGLACGLAVLTKGPVGFLLPGAVILAIQALDRAATRDPAAARRGGVTWRGVACGVVGIALVAGPWAAALAGRIGVKPILAILARESIARAGPGLDHPRPIWYYLATFWPLFLPWSLLAPVAVVRALAPKADPDPASGRAMRFLVVWAGVVILFFSVLTDKNDAWILPAAPPCALLVATQCGRRLVRCLAACAACVLAGAVLLGGDAISGTRSLRGIAVAAHLAREDPYDLIAYRVERASLVWYADREVAWVRSGEELEAALDATPRDRALAVLMTQARWERMDAVQRERLGGFALVAARDGYLVWFREATGGTTTEEDRNTVSPRSPPP